jgi:hypothetical protein
MLEFFFSDINTPYTVAMGIVLTFALIEGIGLLVGLSLLELLDNISPIDLDIDTSSPLHGGRISSLLNWLCLSKLPMLIWLIIALTHFSMIGFAINYISLTTLQWQPTLFITFLITAIGALIMTHFIGSAFAQIRQKNETYAVSTSTFIGKWAKVTIGTATKGKPAEAVLTDNFNQNHYLMVEPEYEEEHLTQGSQIVIVQKLATSWLAIKFR